mmetsp:Transcript_19930/g.27469  ORF Transcript_19930/g.27469 Transcript_19930/m.27469 type:complete len:594 (+) Transcript_19930:22-1803(+)
MSAVSAGDAAHEFGALNTLLLVVILGLCVLSAYLIKQNSFYYLPESACAILVGMIVGCLAKAIYPSSEEMEFLSFEPQMFFFLLLPPIIFEAGYSLRKKDFFANFWTVSLYAVFGTIISTFIIGYLVYAVGLTGMAHIDTSSPLEALMFGALISAVDPVATLSIMGNPELNCDPLLYSLVFGESVLNDAVAIVLFKTFASFYDSGEAFSQKTIPAVMLNFTIVSLGSVVIGVLIGLFCSYLCKHTQMWKYPEYEVSMLFLFAYGSYSFSEALQLSGIMSLFFCGIILSHYNGHNLSATSQVTAHNIFKSLAVLSEFFIFLYIGMGFIIGRFLTFQPAFFVLCMVFCLVSRVFNIYPLSFLANLMRTKVIPLQMQSVMWFAGLRGAISFALSQNMPGENKKLYISTTLYVVIFTTIVCGGLTEPIMNRMGMRAAISAHLPAGGSKDVESGKASRTLCSSPSGHSEGVLGLGSEDGAGSSSNKASGSGGRAARSTATRGKADVTTVHRNSVNPGNGNSSNSSSSSLGSAESTDPDHSLGIPLKMAFLQRFEMTYMRPLFGGPSRGDSGNESDGDSSADDSTAVTDSDQLLSAQER